MTEFSRLTDLASMVALRRLALTDAEIAAMFADAAVDPDLTQARRRLQAAAWRMVAVDGVVPVGIEAERMLDADREEFSSAMAEFSRLMDDRKANHGDGKVSAPSSCKGEAAKISNEADLVAGLVREASVPDDDSPSPSF